MLYSALPLPEFTYEVPRYFHTGTWEENVFISDVGKRGKKDPIFDSYVVQIFVSAVEIGSRLYYSLVRYVCVAKISFSVQYVCVVNNYAVTVSA